MLGQPMAMLIPEVVGFELTGKLPPGATATDLVLTVTQMLRKKGVVDKFVEFYGPGIARAVAARPRDDREHGARVRRDDGLLPRRRTRRSTTCASPAAPTSTSSSSSATRKENLLWHDPSAQAAVRRHAVARPRHRRAVARRPRAPAGSRAAEDVAPRVAQGRRRPPRRQGRRRRRRRSRRGPTTAAPQRPGNARRRPTQVTTDKGTFPLGHGSVVIAAITSCTNTSNPSVLLAAGLLAQKAVAQGPRRASRGSRRRSRRARRSSPTTSPRPA